MKCYQAFSRTCCSEELSASKSSLSQGPLPLKEGFLEYLVLRRLHGKNFQHHRSVVSSSCPALGIEKERASLEGDSWSDIH